MKEIWKDIVGYEGLYQVSNMGRVKSLGNDGARKEKILKPITNGQGYLLVCLCKDGKTKNFRIHRLVALHFIPNPNNLPTVNHLDEDKNNNCVTNLEWCSSEYNHNYGTRNQRVSEKMTNGKLSIPIVQLDPSSNKVLNVYPSTMEAERNGFYHSSIAKCIKGRYKTHRGYKWQYLHEYLLLKNPKIKEINLFRKQYNRKEVNN